MRVLRLFSLAIAAAIGSSSCASNELTSLDGVQRALNLGQNARVADEQKDAVALAAEGDRLRDRIVPDYRAAHDAYQLALQLEPRNPYVLVAMATAYIREAGEEFERSKPSLLAFRPFGDSVAARNARKHFNRALGACNDALQINPNHGGAHFALGEAYARMEEWSLAAEKFDELEKKKLLGDRELGAFHAWRGYVRTKTGNASGAREDFEKAMELGRPQPFAEYADYVANPPSFLETLFSWGGVMQFEPVVGVEQ